MKPKFPYLLFILILVTQISIAQKKSMVTVSLRDNITYMHLDSAKIELLYQDTIKVKFKTLMQKNGDYQMELDYRPGTYTLLADKKGYTTGIKHFSISSYRGSIVNTGFLFLEKERHIRMKDVTVTSTRIKMVMRGDTIVYDAAAFELAEGSMLDALVAQLPGAELADGQIKVNGRVMESLLVNGEEFFSGNPQIALQNLPAYTVKDIKVYNRENKDSYLKSEAQKRMEHEEHLVMDVTLKKKYMKGMIGNVDLGYGLPDNRYMGKIFALGYFRHTRLAAFANLNNIKNTQIGNTRGSWGYGWNQEGELDLQMGGIDVSYSRNKVNYNGHVYLTQEDIYTAKQISRVNYFTSGDIYGRSSTENQNLRKHFISEHTLEIRADKAMVSIRPNIDFKRDNSTRQNRQAEFIQSPEESYRMEALDSLFAPNWTSSRYTRMLLNRQAQETEECNDQLNVGNYALATIKLPNLANDLLRITASAKYRRDTQKPNLSYIKQYGSASGQTGSGERLLQRTDDVAKNYNILGKIGYDWVYSPYQVGRTHGWTIMPALEVQRNHSDHSYLIHNLLENNAPQDQPILPPSAINPGMLALDRANSYNSVWTQDNYTPSLNIKYHLSPSAISSRQYLISFLVKSQMQKEHLSYQKDQIDTTVTRFSNRFSPNLNISYYREDSKKYCFWTLGYNYNESLPNLNYQIRTSNSSDPNNIYMTRPDLKRPQTHLANFTWQEFDKETYQYFKINASYTCTNQAIANAKRYDRNSGVNYWQPENINGNWNSNAQVNYSIPLGKKKAFQLETNTNASFVHSVDYVSDTEELIRSAVDNLNLSEGLKITYKFGKQVIGAAGKISWLRNFSNRNGFVETNAIDLSGGIDGTFNLPANWQIVTDFSVLNRNGYADNTLNTTYCIWNASVSKSILKGNLTFKLDASDILNQISNVTHNINAQGQTETWVNTLPRFAMLRVIYKLNKTPKK